MRSVSSAHAAVAASTSPAASSASTQHGEQLDGSQPVVADDAQPRRAMARGQIVVAAGEVQASGGQRVPASPGPCRASNASASAKRPCRMRRSASAMSGCQLGTCMAASKSALARVEHLLGLPHRPELDQQRGLHAVAVARQEHRARPVSTEMRPRRRSRSRPRPGPFEVGGVVAGGEERADRLGRGVGVVGRTARQCHRLVEQCHALDDPTGLHVGQPGVGQRLGLQVDVTEAAGPIERQLRRRQQLGRVIDVASHRGHRHPALLQAWRLVLDQPPGPSEPGPARRQVAHRVGEQSPSRTHAIAARHGSPAAVNPRMAADRCATTRVDVRRSAPHPPARAPSSRPRRPPPLHTVTFRPGRADESAVERRPHEAHRARRAGHGCGPTRRTLRCRR